MPVGTETEIDTISGRDGRLRKLQPEPGDISGDGVEESVGNVTAVSVFLSTVGAVEVTIQLSPNDGTDWFEPEESPVVFDAEGDAVAHIRYNITRIRVQASDDTPVKAIAREVV